MRCRATNTRRPQCETSSEAQDAHFTVRRVLHARHLQLEAVRTDFLQQLLTLTRGTHPHVTEHPISP
eukprot:scaffold87308_cov16-Tisochrysis_lutea.AAC.1